MSEEEQYEDTISNEDIDSLINTANKTQSENAKLHQMVNTMSTQSKDSNFLHIQISTDEMLDKLEHFYKGDYQGYDDNGDLVWKKQEDKDLITFNEFGVTSIMEIITKYIDKNTILSDYNERRVYEIMSDIGEDIILFLLCNYEKMGMNTHFKKTKFRLIITTTCHIIESTYRRAMRGKTLQELNQSKVVGQFGNPQVPIQGRPQTRSFMNRLFNP